MALLSDATENGGTASPVWKRRWALSPTAAIPPRHLLLMVTGVLSLTEDEI